tara:strand:+ start:1995 stop:2606 length:612 start_codon:yes stop_codon:yes gene_type:complete
MSTEGLCENLIYMIRQWHHARNLIDGATDKDQVCKLIQEVGELSDNVCKGNDIKDDIGDIIVVLINIAERNNVTIAECLDQAYNDIKDRKGTMVDGIFIKETTMPEDQMSLDIIDSSEYDYSGLDTSSVTISAASPGITTVSLYDDFSLDYSYDEDATNILDLSEYLTTGSSLDNDDTITIKISDIDLGDSEDYFAIDENKGS